MLMLRTLLIVLFYLQCFSRVFETSMKFTHLGNNNGWVYLDKMVFAPGKIEYQAQIFVKGIPYGNGGILTIEPIPSNLWSHEKQVKCTQKTPAQQTLKYNLSFSEQKTLKVFKSFNIEQTTYFYFVLKDCEQNLKQEYQNDNLNLHIKLHLQNNGREVGEEQDHWYIVPLIIVANVWLVYYYMTKMKDTNIKTQMHKIIMFVGIATQVSSLTWRTFGFLVYTFSGYDFGFFHFIYLFMHTMSEFVVIELLILIGLGWTISFVTFNDEFVTKLSVCLSILPFTNGFSTLVWKYINNEQDRHHLFDFENPMGFLGIRIALVVELLLCILCTYLQTGKKVKKFLVYFSIYGTLYISALPIISIVANNFVLAKDRHQFVFMAVETVKCLANIALSLMLNSQRSQYTQISYKNRSFVPQGVHHF